MKNNKHSQSVQVTFAVAGVHLVTLLIIRSFGNMLYRLPLLSIGTVIKVLLEAAVVKVEYILITLNLNVVHFMFTMTVFGGNDN